jgi:hypothetical protein
MSFISLWGGGGDEVNCKRIGGEFLEPKGVSHKDWRIFYDTYSTDADKSELLGLSKCRRL